MPTDLPPRRPSPVAEDQWNDLLLAALAGVFLAFLMMAFLAGFGGGKPPLLRLGDAWVGSIDIAIKKARTAVFFAMPTGTIGKLPQPGGSLS